MRIPPGKLRLLVLLLAAACLSACGARGFKRDGATRDDFMRDLRQCLYEAKIPANRCYPGSGFCGRDEYRNVCMERKGWRISREDGRFMAPN